MSLGWHARRRWALVILLVGLPTYVAMALGLVTMYERPGVWVELAIFVLLGIAWAVPLRFIFRGVARPDPEARDHRKEGS